jgi:hypothetical protein
LEEVLIISLEEEVLVEAPSLFVRERVACERGKERRRNR